MTVKKGLAIFVALSLLVSGTVLFMSVDASSVEVFKSADAGRMAVAMLLVVIVFALDALKIKALVRAAGERITFRLSMQLTLINYFGAAVTPMQSGGGPFQMYMMYRRGIGVGKAVAITLVRTILTMLILGFTIPFTLMFHVDLPVTGLRLKGFIFYVIAFIMVSWFLIALSLVRPKLIKRLIGMVVMLLKRLGFLKPKLVLKIVKWVDKEIDAYNLNVRDFITRGRSYFLLGILAGIGQMWAYLSVMPCMIWAMGTPVAYAPVMYVECVLIQALFLFMLYFIPTPGGSVVAEGGAAAIFSLFVPWNVAGMLGLCWRFLTEHTGIALGLIVAIRELGWNVASDIASGSVKSVDDSEEAP
ncbi:MAG: flippase-like domain-containing protein [Synergistaceae bacterium]|nr:flippase-like domain-containing protein [Synergistaceae bacterium]